VFSIREAREMTGLTQEALAVRAGTSRSALAAIESGARSASDAMVERLLLATGLRPAVVLAARREALLAVLERHGVTGARVAGSVARGTDGLHSDLDLVIHPPDGMGGLGLAALGEEVEAVLGLAVDLISDRSSGPVADVLLSSSSPL
jgi:predicted nucleotidyltransferase/DNA-binding XRE family transcriptional regulator